MEVGPWHKPAGRTIVVYENVEKGPLLPTASCTGDTGPWSAMGTKLIQDVDPHSNVIACEKFEFEPHKTDQG